jgi:diguanylate cyclase (GGDEF)-like protein
MKRASRSGEALSLVLIDIDDFKRLNDTFGHAVGDQILKAVAAVMKAVTRETDLLARYGGEEFALLSFRNDLDCATELAEKLRLAISRAKVAGSAGSKPKWIQVTASMGVAEYRGDPSFFEEADRALYSAKASGKDCVVTAREVQARATQRRDT